MLFPPFGHLPLLGYDNGFHPISPCLQKLHGSAWPVLKWKYSFVQHSTPARPIVSLEIDKVSDVFRAQWFFLKLRPHEELESWLDSFFFDIGSGLCHRHFANSLSWFFIKYSSVIVTKVYHGRKETRNRNTSSPMWAEDLTRLGVRVNANRARIISEHFCHVRNLLPWDWMSAFERSPQRLYCPAMQGPGKVQPQPGVNCIELQITWPRKDSLCALTD